MRVARVRRQQQQQQGEDSELVISPSAAQLEEADMSLLYCGTAERCTFLELQAGAPLKPAVRWSLQRAFKLSHGRTARCAYFALCVAPPAPCAQLGMT